MSYKKERIKYYDTLRFLAILGIIILHNFSLFQDVGLIGDKIYSISEITRFGVPIFLMLTGALLLNRDIELGDFFKRRLPRVIYPFIFFIILHIIILFLFGNYFNYPQLIKSIYKLPFSYNWYFWMILGVYLFIPIINKFIKNASMKEIEYFIIVVFGASLFYQLTLYFNIAHFFDLNFFLGPIAFVVLGYYLSKKEFNTSTKKIILFALLIFIITTLLKIGGQLDLPYNLFHNYQAAKSPILHSKLDLGFVQLIQASSIFILFKYIYRSTSGISFGVKKVLENSIINKIILSISKASYGMYLMNNTLEKIIGVLIVGVSITKPETIILLILIIIGVTIFSWIFVLVINKIPYLSKWSGYH